MEFGHLEGVPQPQVLGTYILYNQVMGWSSKYMGVQKKAAIYNTAPPGRGPRRSRTTRRYAVRGPLQCVKVAKGPAIRQRPAESPIIPKREGFGHFVGYSLILNHHLGSECMVYLPTNWPYQRSMWVDGRSAPKCSSCPKNHGISSHSAVSWFLAFWSETCQAGHTTSLKQDPNCRGKTFGCRRWRKMSYKVGPLPVIGRVTTPSFRGYNSICH